MQLPVQLFNVKFRVTDVSCFANTLLLLWLVNPGLAMTVLCDLTKLHVSPECKSLPTMHATVRQPAYVSDEKCDLWPNHILSIVHLPCYLNQYNTRVEILILNMAFPETECRIKLVFLLIEVSILSQKSSHNSQY